MNTQMVMLRNLEVALHKFEVRTDRSKLETLLHDSFIEIGYSGKTYTYKSILNMLSNEEPSEFIIWSQDYEYIELTPNLIQLIYKQARMDKDGVLSRYAKRTSIWSKNKDRWQMKYHQATPTEAFEKSNV